MEIYPFDYSRLNRDLGVKGDDLKKYLISEKYIETESKTIKDLAEVRAKKIKVEYYCILFLIAPLRIWINTALLMILREH